MDEIAFDAKLVGEGPRGAWKFLYLPKAATTILGERGGVSVAGMINGSAFCSSVFPTGDGGHSMIVTKAMRTGAKAAPGNTVRVVLRRDTAPRTVDVPKDRRAALSNVPPAKAIFERLAWSHNKAYVDWIDDAKRAEARARRVEETIACLKAGRKRLN